VIERGATDKHWRFKLSLPRKEAQPDRPVQLVASADGFGLDRIELPQKEMLGDITLHLVAKGRQRLVSVSKPDVEPAGSGKTLDLGEIKVKPRRE
jgi:hypothetical protein